jgi:hypothetical protein
MSRVHRTVSRWEFCHVHDEMRVRRRLANCASGMIRDGWFRPDSAAERVAYVELQPWRDAGHPGIATMISLPTPGSQPRIAYFTGVRRARGSDVHWASSGTCCGLLRWTMDRAPSNVTL